MAGEQEPQRPIDCVFYADAGRYSCLGHGESVIAELERRGWVKKVCAILRGAGEAERQAKAARTRGELPNVGLGRKAAIFGHLHNAEFADRFEGAQQHTSGLSFRLAGNIHAEILAVYGVHISVAGRAEQNLVAGSWSAMGMGGRIGRYVVRAKISLDFDDAADDWAGSGEADQQLSEQAGGDVLGMSIKEGTWHEAAGRRGAAATGL